MSATAIATTGLPDPLKDRDTKVLIACHCREKHGVIYVHEHFIQDIGKTQNVNNFTRVEEYYSNPPYFIDIPDVCDTQLDPTQKFIQLTHWDALPRDSFDVIWSMYCPIFGKVSDVLRVLLRGALRNLRDYGMLVIPIHPKHEREHIEILDQFNDSVTQKVYVGPIDTVLKQYDKPPLNTVYIFQKMPRGGLPPIKKVVGSAQQFFENMVQRLGDNDFHVSNLETPRHYSMERAVIEQGIQESIHRKTHIAFYDVVRQYFYNKALKLQEVGLLLPTPASAETYFEFMLKRLNEDDFNVSSLQDPNKQRVEQQTFARGVFECVNFQHLVAFMNLVQRYYQLKDATLQEALHKQQPMNEMSTIIRNKLHRGK